MHSPSTASLSSQPDPLRRLLDSILAGDDVTLFIRSDDGRALLDAAAECLAKLRCRALRVSETSSDGLTLPTLMAQVTGQPYTSARNDEFLKHGFQALTAVDATCDRIVLLISDANTLQPAALRYIQLACQAGTSLQLVLAGKRGLLDLFDASEFAYLRKRLATGPIITPLAPRPAAAVVTAVAALDAFTIPDVPQPPRPSHAAPATPEPETIRLRTVLPPQSSFSSGSYRRRRLAALTGIGLAMAGCAALVVWAGGSGDRATRSQQAMLVFEPPAVPDRPAIAATEAQSADVAVPTPEAPPPLVQPEAPQPQPPPGITEEASAPTLQPPAAPLSVAPPSAPKSAARRSAPVQPRVAASRAPAFNAGSVAAWEDPYPPAREWRSPPPAQAVSDLPEQPQSYIGTYSTDANGLRTFRFSR